ncbi:MAG: metal-dependent transcriptional regulator [Sulfolobaceae archaeon]
MEKLSESIENYLKEIYQLEEIKGYVRVIDLINTLDISPGTVSKILDKLEKLGLIERKNRKILLTEDGKKIAQKLIRSHMISERLLTDILGVDWIRAHEIAHKLEHIWPDDVLDRIDEILGRPKTCPHGHPIPGRIKIKGIPLTEAEENKDYYVMLIVKEREDILRELDRIGIKPGVKIKILKKSGDRIDVMINDSIKSINNRIGEQIIVNNELERN